MMSKRFIKCVFGRFSKEHTCQKEEYENPRKSLPKKRKKYSTSPVYSPTCIEKVLPS